MLNSLYTLLRAILFVKALQAKSVLSSLLIKDILTLLFIASGLRLSTISNLDKASSTKFALLSLCRISNGNLEKYFLAQTKYKFSLFVNIIVIKFDFFKMLTSNAWFIKIIISSTLFDSIKCRSFRIIYTKLAILV